MDKILGHNMKETAFQTGTISDPGNTQSVRICTNSPTLCKRMTDTIPPDTHSTTWNRSLTEMIFYDLVGELEEDNLNVAFPAEIHDEKLNQTMDQPDPDFNDPGLPYYPDPELDERDEKEQEFFDSLKLDGFPDNEQDSREQ